MATSETVRSWMMRALVICTPLLLMAPSSAGAVPITITGNVEGSGATASGTLSVADGTLMLSITNTSAFDLRITGLGFSLFGDGATTNNVRGFTGASQGQFAFSDSVGYVPQVGNMSLITSPLMDLGWLTGTSFAAGRASRGLVAGETLTFAVSGDFLGLTESDLATGLFVRFQDLDGLRDDVGTARASIPEPAMLLLVGGGLIAAVARRRRSRTDRSL